MHPGLAVWVLGTFARVWEPPCAKRVVWFFFFVSQLLPFPPVVGTFLAGKDRAE